MGLVENWAKNKVLLEKIWVQEEGSMVGGQPSVSTIGYVAKKRPQAIT